MDLDSGIPLSQLLVDGGMTVNDFLMQLQADILGIDVGKQLFHNKCLFTKKLYTHAIMEIATEMTLS